MASKMVQTTVFIVNFNSADFIKLTLYALKKLTCFPYQVHILDNGSELEDYSKLQQICAKANNVVLDRHETDLRGSMAHGTALNYLTRRIETPYFSILDADATWLRKDWDRILMERLTGKIKVIGTQAPVGSEKFQDFPLMFCILFETQAFQQLDIDFRPKDIAAAQDTGYELREKYLHAGFRGQIIEMKNTRTYLDGPFRNCVCAEYYLDGDYDRIFASHFSRGSSTKFKDRYKRHLWYYRIRGIRRFTTRHVKQIERWKWSRVCRKIIRSQV